METTPQPIVLTERQTRVLWLLSMGKTCSDIARENGNSPSFTRKYCTRIFRLMRASTAAQAVRNGLLDGVIGPYEDCGSLAAYRRHIKREEPTCAACKRGNRERLDREALLRTRRTKLGEPEIRLLRAFDAGRTLEQICVRWGISHRAVKDLTASAYTALGVDHLPAVVRREAAMREARMRGLLRDAPPPPERTPAMPVHLSETHVRILVSMESGATLSQTAERLGLRPGTCSTRLSEAYRRLDVGWMDKGTRLPAALRRARELGLLPEPATT
jgi:DNA-binding NarL/FixJ family response regulator